MEVFVILHSPAPAPASSCCLLPVCRPSSAGNKASVGRQLPRLSLSYTGSAGRVNASRMMTSCGQRSRNVLAVFSLLFPAGKTSVGLKGLRKWGGGRESLPG